MRSYLVQCHIRVTWDFLGVHVILTWGLTERKNSLPSLSVVFFFGTVQFIRVIALWIHLPVGSIYLDMWFWMSCPFADRPGSTSPGLLASPSDSATPNLTGSVITLPLPITQDSQATMAPPPPAGGYRYISFTGTLAASIVHWIDG